MQYKEKKAKYNCFSGTLYALNIKKVLEWASQYEIVDFLKYDTIKIDKKDLKKGDILILRCHIDGVCHSAIYLGKNKYWHKVGGLQSEYNTLEGILKIYNDDYDYIEFYRKK